MIANQIKPTSNYFEEVFFDKIYWLNKLSGELPETSIITDYVRPILYCGENTNINFEFSKDLSQRIIKVTHGSYLSIYILLVATLNILLQKYTGNSDIIVGSPIYQKYQNYNYEEVINKIVPLRTHIPNQLSFKDFLLEVKETVIGAYSHQNYSFDELVNLLKLTEIPNRCPIFDIVILLQNIHNPDCTRGIKNDLTISFIVNDNSICGKIEYNQSLFKDETVKLIIQHYLSFIENILYNTNSNISEIKFLTEDEQNKLLQQFNNNTKNFPVEKTIDDLFEEQVEKAPNRIAVIDENTNFTYKHLNEKANQLARLLQSLGVKTKDFVGILKQRNTDFLIAILAILKIGAVYVPIDSSYPLERIKYMVSNSEVRILLTDSSCIDTLKSCLNCPHLTHLICLDKNLDKKPSSLTLNIAAKTVNILTPLDFENLPKSNLQLNNQGIAPAYMIYTSGSTGLPKGTIIRHGGAINHIYAQFDALALNESKFTFLQSAPASSDISVWQFLAPILIGGKTVIVNTETVCHPEKLFQVIKEKKITIVELVPVVLTSLLDYISQLTTHERFLPDLKWMMVTGESASVELVNRWLRIYPQIKIVNAYGPTEAADDITQYIIESPLAPNQRTVPIGKPLANLNLYILDPQMQLAPIGVPGEICVSGFGVGQGYWKNEESTQRSFVPNPFADTAKPLPGTDIDFVYKTGDLGRWLPDGNIEFFGRIDNQVKIRGFRIELGEIEAVLSQHPAVGETVVVVREDTSGDKRLVAYLVPTKHLQQDDIPQIRLFLQERLPEYMLPSAFVLIESLPLTPSGKVNRQALPAPDISKGNLEIGFVQPRTSTEKVVANIWSQILNREQVGIHDNFFDLGGHSLLATQVISRLREAFKVELPLRSLFEEPTVAKLVEYIDKNIEKNLTLQQLQTLTINIADDREEIEL